VTSDLHEGVADHSPRAGFNTDLNLAYPGSQVMRSRSWLVATVRRWYRGSQGTHGMFSGMMRGHFIMHDLIQTIDVTSFWFSAGVL
jgi:hypothetical protein